MRGTAEESHRRLVDVDQGDPLRTGCDDVCADLSAELVIRAGGVPFKRSACASEKSISQSATCVCSKSER